MLSKALILPRLSSSLVVRRSFQTSSVANTEHWWNPEQANGREVVGLGAYNGEDYQDRQDFWYPAIRFRKDDAVILPIKEKELGDWKNLSMDEKKLLYRYSYRQTMAEFKAPHGYWWPSVPVTFDPEYKEAETERALVLKKELQKCLPRHSIMKTIDGNRDLAFLLAVFHLNQLKNQVSKRNSF